MASYGVSNDQAGTPQATTTTYKTQTQITGATATLRRAFLFEAIFGLTGTPANNSYTMALARQSTLGTGTALTPSPLDLADAAAGTVGTGNFTAEPTTGVTLLAFPLNQQSSARWVAYGDGQRMVVPATNITGIGAMAKSSAGTVTSIIAFQFAE